MLDPMYVDIQQSSTDLLKLRRALANGGATPASAAVRLKLEDGSDYGFTGTVEFSEAMVDTATGTVTLRARFANPQGLLLPGMFVRASFAQATDPNAFLIPQIAVTRDAKGNPQVYIVGPGNKAVARPVTTTRTVGVNWVVTAGLNAGDKVITEGVGKVKPGQPVKPVAAGSPQRLRPPNKDTSRGQQRQGGLTGDVQNLHRPADLRVGDRDHHHAGRAGQHLHAAGRAIPRHRPAHTSTSARAIPAHRQRRSKTASRR